jgi:hypothetical protein
MAGLPKGCKSVAVQTAVACDLFETIGERAFKQWGLSRAKQAAGEVAPERPSGAASRRGTRLKLAIVARQPLAAAATPWRIEMKNFSLSV